MIDKKAWKYVSHNKSTILFLILILGSICTVVSIFYSTKFALEKVFFKKYKHFELNPNSNLLKKIGKIS